MHLCSMSTEQGYVFCEATPEHLVTALKILALLLCILKRPKRIHLLRALLKSTEERSLRITFSH